MVVTDPQLFERTRHIIELLDFGDVIARQTQNLEVLQTGQHLYLFDGVRRQ